MHFEGSQEVPREEFSDSDYNGLFGRFSSSAAMLLNIKLNNYMEANKDVAPFATPTDSMKFIARSQLDLLAAHQYKNVENNFELLRAIDAPANVIVYLFARVHEKLNPAAYPVALPEIGFFYVYRSDPFTEEAFRTNIVGTYCSDGKIAMPANPGKKWRLMSNGLLRKAQEGNKQYIKNVVDFWLLSGAPKPAVAQMLRESCPELLRQRSA